MIRERTTESFEFCQYLGLANSPGVRCLGASASHRCHREKPPSPVGMAEQAEYCLSGGFRDCPQLHGARIRSHPETVASLFGWEWRSPRIEVSGVARYLLNGLLGLAWMGLAITAVVVLAPMLVATTPAASDGVASQAARYPTATSAPMVAAADTGDLAGAAQVAKVPAEPDEHSGGTNELPGDEPARRDAGETTAAQVASPSPAATAKPATQVPSDAPSGEKVYVVQKKDTLYSLAKANGVTVKEIMEANGLKDESFIWSGQKLIIPAPR